MARMSHPRPLERRRCRPRSSGAWESSFAGRARPSHRPGRTRAARAYAERYGISTDIPILCDSRRARPTTGTDSWKARRRRSYSTPPTSSCAAMRMPAVSSPACRARRDDRWSTTRGCCPASSSSTRRGRFDSPTAPVLRGLPRSPRPRGSPSRGLRTAIAHVTPAGCAAAARGQRTAGTGERYTHSAPIVIAAAATRRPA